MDHRCLYGHRIPENFTFAISQRLCPTCGAPCVTLEGYRLARRMTQEIPLEALAAFNVVRMLELHYTVTPRVETSDDSANSQRVEVAPPPEDPPAEERRASRGRLASPPRSEEGPMDTPPARRKAGEGPGTAEREFFSKE